MADHSDELRRKAHNEGRLLRGKRPDYRAGLCVIGLFAAVDFWVIELLQSRTQGCTAQHCTVPPLYLILPLILIGLGWAFVPVKPVVRTIVWVIGAALLFWLARKGPYTDYLSYTLPLSIVPGGVLLLPRLKRGTNG